jgi:hypothetical protein
MEMSRAAVGVIAAVCVAGGAVGAYLANGTGSAAPVMIASGADISADPAALTVEQSEAIVGNAVTPTTLDVPVAAAPSAPARTTARPRAAERRPSPRTVATSPGVVIEEPQQRVALPPAVEPVRMPDPEPARVIEPSAPEFEELVISEDSVVGLQVETSISSEQARVEDEVVARVTRDLRVGDRVAIPAGARALGEVTLVERGGRLRDRARLGIRFTSVVLADGTRIPLETETIYREGDSPTNESAAKIGGGAIGGAIIGGIIGGAKGAAIGGAIGAGGGSAAVMAGGRNPATLPSGTPVTVRVMRPTTVTVEK